MWAPQGELLRTLQDHWAFPLLLLQVMVAERRCEGVTCVLPYLIVVGAGVNDDALRAIGYIDGAAPVPGKP